MLITSEALNIKEVKLSVTRWVHADNDVYKGDAVNIHYFTALLLHTPLTVLPHIKHMLLRINFLS